MRYFRYFFLGALGLAGRLAAQPTSSPRLSLAFGPRLGGTDYAFNPTDSRSGWGPALQARLGYSAGGFAEISAANGALRLRTDAALLRHAQRYTLGTTEATRTDLRYTATEAAIKATVLVRVGRWPIYAVVGAEVARTLASRVSGHYLLAASSPPGYTLVGINEPYRRRGALDFRPVVGASAIIRQRIDITFHVAWGGRFRAYAPRELTGNQVIGALAGGLLGGGSAPVYPTEADFREMRIVGNQLTVGYRFGTIAASRGPWRTTD